MCVNPITINRVNECVRGYHKSRTDLKDTMRFISKNKSELKSYSRLKRYGLVPTLSTTITVPCGKCVECLKKRQMDLSSRCMREALKRGSMIFVTLTYDDEHLPLACSIECINKSTGEVSRVSEPSIITKYKNEQTLSFLGVVRNKLSLIPASSSSRRVVVPFFDTEELSYQYVVTPSLCRRDIRLWLKRSRVRYERKEGKKLPDFSYVIVGEYGPKTCRPHYHIAFFGLTKSIVEWFVSEWDYGIIYDIQTVSAVNEDGSSGYAAASRYIGKYITKGKFECDSVKDCISEKPRLLCSKNVGNGLTPGLVSYYRCYDLFGEYDIDTLRLTSGEYLTVPQLKLLKKEVYNRNHFSVSDFVFPLPKTLLKRLWYVPSERTPGSYRASTIRTYFASLMDYNPLDYIIFNQRKISPDSVTKDFVLSSAKFLNLSSSLDEIKADNDEKILYEFYSNSIF